MQVSALYTMQAFCARQLRAFVACSWAHTVPLRLRAVAQLGMIALSSFSLVAHAQVQVQGQVPVTPRKPAPVVVAPPKEKGPMFIDAERLEGVMDIEMTARGRAELRQDDMTIFGEVLRMNEEYRRIDGEGGVRLEMGNDRFSGNRLRMETSTSVGSFTEPTYQFRGQDRPIRGNAELMQFQGKDRYSIRRGSFTSCEPGRDDWHVDFTQLDLDYEEGAGTVTNAQIHFKDATLFTLPWLTFPLESRRKTGFTAPSYYHTTRGGTEIETPFYWNIAPERDLMLTPHYISARGYQLNSDFRYIDRSYKGNLRVEYLPDDKQLKQTRSGFTWQHQQTLAPGLTALADINRVSDDRYYVDLNTRIRNTSQVNLQRLATLNYSGSVAGQGFSSGLLLQRFQTLQDPLAPITAPYDRLPQLTMMAQRNDIGGVADAKLPAEFVRFSNPTLVYGNRVSLNPSVSVPYLTPGYYANARFGMRHVSYNLERQTAGTADRISANIPWFSLDTGLLFERDTQLFSQDLTQTFEPRLYYLRAAYRNQSNIPIFDTGLADLNFASIFSENRFAGGDRFGDANEVTIAGSSRFILPNGAEIGRVTLGERFYFADERVTLNSTATPRTYDHSDILGALSARLDRNWTFDTGVQYNPRDSRTERFGANFRYNPEIAKLLNVGYRFTRDALDQIDTYGQWPMGGGWFTVGRVNYSLRDRLMIESLGGLEYNGGCWVFRVFAQRVQVATSTSTTAIYLQLELNDFVKMGSDPFDLLNRSVPGYRATNLGGADMVPSLIPRLPFQMQY